MKQLLKKQTFEFFVNTDFNGVISQCKSISRPGQDGTWITEEMRNAYNDLHHAGYAHSAEVRLNGELVGGLYGIRLGKCFMVRVCSAVIVTPVNMHLYAMWNYLKSEAVELIDCQVYTAHR